jgi:hypothetical protein
MRGKRLLTLVLGLVGVLALGAIPAGAEPSAVPPYEGLLSFPPIQDSSGPEEFSWEVILSPGQELQPIDDRTAGVYYKDGGRAESIAAERAHDVTGTEVPTTLSVTAPNIVTLVVHHRAGNPLAAGAPFQYPVLAGAGYTITYSTAVVTLPPGEFPWTGCTIPKLTGYTLRVDRRRLKNAGCGLGTVRGHRAAQGLVFKQVPAPGSMRALGSAVDVRVAG